MKGIVFEELKDKLIVLTEEGDFIEIGRLIDNVEIGEEIVIKGEKRNTKQTLKRFTFAAAIFAMIILGSYGVYGCFITQGYVSIGINPGVNKNASMEMAYNLFGKTIKLQALNKDGNTLIEKIGGFQFKPTNIVINEFIKAAEKEKVILQEKENTIVITITTSNKKIDDESMDSSVEHYIKDNNIKAKVMIVLGNKTDYERAKQSGVPTGKFILINKALKKNSAYKFGDLNKKSIEEIIHIINEEEKNYK
ncbi:MAG: anti-sigma factor domain-containing protein [Clostridium sp.]|uniref:anti-sigma factor domain-containing protein n=1 Tax=Clostridium sp. TaxID=1506 RepID=UPI0039ECCDE5